MCLFILLKVAGPEEDEASLLSVTILWGGLTVYWMGDIPYKLNKLAGFKKKCEHFHTSFFVFLSLQIVYICTRGQGQGIMFSFNPSLTDQVERELSEIP